ncbi:MAG: hypothetical protein K2P95_03620 [Hyphomonadaceae bacterium]|nr:hypothetical protein [Hyphomonadaceae bacterium]
MAGLLPAAGSPDGLAGPVSQRGRRASGGGGPDGGALGTAGGSGGYTLADPAPNFTITPPPGGYIWWYIDAISADGAHGLTIIAFIGSVFSPYYAAAGRRDPREHVALNVALYQPKSSRWAMTERSAAVLRQTRDSLIIGPSRMIWGAEGLTLHVEETAAPIPYPVRGAIRLRPVCLNAQMLHLDAAGKHRWRPIAPLAEIDVEFTKPKLQWRGTAYFDTNEGEESLESGFRRWHWARAHVNGETLVLYDMIRRDRSTAAHALRFGADGSMASFPAPRAVKLPNTRWGLKRETRAEEPQEVAVLRDWEDGPFYSRSLLRTRLLQEEVTAVHESLDLNRFRAFWVHKLLPYRMPRRG